MQDETAKTATTTANPALGRSTVAKLPPELREAVDKAIADGATIDEITARIREEGESCSRSAVGRYTKDTRELIQKRQEADPRGQGVDAGVRRPPARRVGAGADRPPAGDGDRHHASISPSAKEPVVDRRISRGSPS